MFKAAIKNIKKEGLFPWIAKVTGAQEKHKRFPVIREKTSDQATKNKLAHVSAFNLKNAGDTVLPIVLRDLLDTFIGTSQWENLHVYQEVNKKIVRSLNKNQAIIIGGGGLFIKDTNPNNSSGWQWPCSLDHLRQIQQPIIIFAVGYNRFRGQEEFDPIFTEHLNLLINKAQFVGIRNTGSIQKLKSYLKTDEQKRKLVFQPCMTTLIAKIYPNLCQYNIKEDFIAINCAFDRKDLRLGSDEILKSIAKVVSELSTRTKIKYYSHLRSDLSILPYFDKLNINYELIEFSDPKQAVIEYAKPKLVIGMRGHAQMIPFGCNTPILSIVSHDKLQWFLDDIKHPDWGVDVLDNDFESKLLKNANRLYDDYEAVIEDIVNAQDKLWEVTQGNLNTIKNVLGHDKA